LAVRRKLKITGFERERAVRAMAELCAERGYRETTVEALIERAGLSRASFESMFKGGLEECLLAAENAILGEVVRVVADTYSPDRSEWESGIAGIGAILELMAANPSFARTGYIVVRQAGTERAKDAYEAGITLIVAMIDRLREYGDREIQPPPGAARAALGGAEALIRREIDSGRAAELPRHLPDIVYAATVSFLGQEEALRLARRSRAMGPGRASQE
jgi:AcrR family transcriptional regulator